MSTIIVPAAGTPDQHPPVLGVLSDENTRRLGEYDPTLVTSWSDVAVHQLAATEYLPGTDLTGLIATRTLAVAVEPGQVVVHIPTPREAAVVQRIAARAGALVLMGPDHAGVGRLIAPIRTALAVARIELNAAGLSHLILPVGAWAPLLDGGSEDLWRVLAPQQALNARRWRISAVGAESVLAAAGAPNVVDDGDVNPSPWPACPTDDIIDLIGELFEPRSAIPLWFDAESGTVDRGDVPRVQVPHTTRSKVPSWWTTTWALKHGVAFVAVPRADVIVLDIDRPTALTAAVTFLGAHGIELVGALSGSRDVSGFGHVTGVARVEPTSRRFVADGVHALERDLCAAAGLPVPDAHVVRLEATRPPGARPAKPGKVPGYHLGVVSVGIDGNPVLTSGTAADLRTALGLGTRPVALPFPTQPRPRPVRRAVTTTRTGTPVVAGTTAPGSAQAAFITAWRLHSRAAAAMTLPRAELLASDGSRIDTSSWVWQIALQLVWRAGATVDTLLEAVVASEGLLPYKRCTATDPKLIGYLTADWERAGEARLLLEAEHAIDGRTVVADPRTPSQVTTDRAMTVGAFDAVYRTTTLTPEQVIAFAAFARGATLSGHTTGIALDHARWGELTGQSRHAIATPVHGLVDAGVLVLTGHNHLDANGQWQARRYDLGVGHGVVRPIPPLTSLIALLDARLAHAPGMSALDLLIIATVQAATSPVRSADLAAMWAVAPQTIRRSVATLVDAGILTRTGHSIEWAGVGMVRYAADAGAVTAWIDRTAVNARERAGRDTTVEAPVPVEPVTAEVVRRPMTLVAPAVGRTGSRMVDRPVDDRVGPPRLAVVGATGGVGVGLDLGLSAIAA